MSDTAVFHAYVRNDLLPSVAEITRAMSSRGFKVEIPEVETLAADKSTELAVKIDAQDVPVKFQIISAKDGGFDALRAGLGEHYDQGTYKEVLRQMVVFCFFFKNMPYVTFGGRVSFACFS